MGFDFHLSTPETRQHLLLNLRLSASFLPHRAIKPFEVMANAATYLIIVNSAMHSSYSYVTRPLTHFRICKQSCGEADNHS